MRLDRLAWGGFGVGRFRNGVYELNGEVKVGESGVSIDSNIDKTKLWHLRLGYMSEMGLKELEKQGVLGGDKIGTIKFSQDCVLGKSTRSSFNKSGHKSNAILDYVHYDLWGPTQELSLGGKRYFVTIINDFSRKV